MSEPNPADFLWRLQAAWPDEAYPEGVVPVPQRIPGRNFFPGGRGLWYEASAKESPSFPTGGVMILGHAFHDLDAYTEILAGGLAGAHSPSPEPTWSNLLELLEAADIAPPECFFTNCFIGLAREAPKEGRFPGADDAAYVERCRDLLCAQIRTMKPRLVLTLGRYVPAFIAPISPQLSHWKSRRTYKDLDARGPAVSEVHLADGTAPPFGVAALVLPSRRPGTVGRRRFGRRSGHNAEVAMVRAALEHRKSLAA